MCTGCKLKTSIESLGKMQAVKNAGACAEQFLSADHKSVN